MPLSEKSTISTPDIPDKTPVPESAIARATDQLLWVLIRELHEQGALDLGSLREKLQPIADSMRISGAIDPSDAEQNVKLATYLALDRVTRRLDEAL